MNRVILALFVPGLFATTANADTWYAQSSKAGVLYSDVTGWDSLPGGGGGSPAALPGAGNADTWIVDINNRTYWNSTGIVWHGATTIVNGVNGRDEIYHKGATIILQDVILQGGDNPRNIGPGGTWNAATLNLDNDNNNKFVGNTLTIASGYTGTLGMERRRASIAFSTYTGDGDLLVSGWDNGHQHSTAGAKGPYRFVDGGDFSTFTGSITFEYVNAGFDYDISGATFDLIIQNEALYNLANSVNVTSLTVDGESFAPGTYDYAAFTAAGKDGFFSDAGGTITVGSPAPDTFQLVITPNDPTSLFKLEWSSEYGMLYRVLGNSGLGTPIDTWSVVEADIAATPPTNTYNVNPAEPSLFYVVQGYPAPPMEIFAENFDGTTPGSLPDGWTTGKNEADNSSLTNWELGTPANVGPLPPGVPLPSAENCVATNISGNYDDPVSDLGVAHTDIWLRSPAIDLGAATAGTLTFQQWTQIEDVAGDLDYGSIRILDASDDSELAVMEDKTIDGNTSGWEGSSMALPDEAFTAAAATIKVEWQFEADDIDSFAGWYIDDVTVTVP